MTRVLIIGYGNPLRHDDAIGWRAAEELARWLPVDDVDVLIRYQLTPELADVVSESNAVIFIDAGDAGEPGDLTCERIEPERERGGFTHECSPGTVLEYCEKIYSRRPRGFQVTLCGEDFDYGEGLSPKVEASLPHLTALVGHLVKSESSRPNAA